LPLRYQALSAQLAKVGLTAAGLDEDTHQAIRQQYRDGLDVFAKANARPGSSAAHIQPSRRRMLTGVQDSSPDSVNFDNLRIGPTPSLPLTLGPYIAQPPLFGTRYTQDFEELGILGKGGYGIVFQCRHKLDGVIYAVKKVPVSERRRQQILIRGQPEVDDLLSELRTLAQLDHPNIVRYFNGWLDYMNLGNSLDESSGSVAGAEDSRTGSFSHGRVIAEASEDHIMFENSVSLTRITPLIVRGSDLHTFQYQKALRSPTYLTRRTGIAWHDE
jgi:translation initiation factor 2-alpha kinase 3